MKKILAGLALLALGAISAPYVAQVVNVAQAQPYNTPSKNVPVSSITGTLPVSKGGTGVTSSTGSGAVVLGTSPNFTTGLTINSGTALTTYTEGSFTPMANSFTVVGTPTYSATYTRIGRLVYLTLQASSTTTTASTLGTSNYTGIPIAAARTGVCTAVSSSGSFTGYSTGLITGSTVYPPAWSANATVVTLCVYEAT